MESCILYTKHLLGDGLFAHFSRDEYRRKVGKALVENQPQRFLRAFIKDAWAKMEAAEKGQKICQNNSRIANEQKDEEREDKGGEEDEGEMTFLDTFKNLCNEIECRVLNDSSTDKKQDILYYVMREHFWETPDMWYEISRIACMMVWKDLGDYQYRWHVPEPLALQWSKANECDVSQLSETVSIRVFQSQTEYPYNVPVRYPDKDRLVDCISKAIKLLGGEYAGQSLGTHAGWDDRWVIKDDHPDTVDATVQYRICAYDAGDDPFTEHFLQFIYGSKGWASCVRYLWTECDGEKKSVVNKEPVPGHERLPVIKRSVRNPVVNEKELFYGINAALQIVYLSPSSNSNQND
jgi:hypothetical protein